MYIVCMQLFLSLLNFINYFCIIILKNHVFTIFVHNYIGERKLTYRMLSKNGKFALFLLLLIIVWSCEERNELDYNSALENPLLIDGPYIMYEQDNVLAYSTDIRGKLQSSFIVPDEDILVIAPKKDPEEFFFKLMDEFQECPVISDNFNQILAISDIEGNYYAFTQLLIGNGVVDESLNWTFGTNHLVLVGDMVDRGSYVTQVLWLIYKMDKDAEKAGGRVHFILGNHDIMCMAGDDRYADEKYIKMAQKLDLEYKELYGENSEIGKWMRTKNVIEKIGNYLFVHGGISPHVLELDLSIEEMNNLVKPYYGEVIYPSCPDEVYRLYKTTGLFWYRGYFKSDEGIYEKATQEEVDAILNYYDALSIIVGHTVVNEIAARYNNSVYAIDVLHPDNQYSNLELQALLIENNNFFRVNEYGDRFPIL